jgi:hypothetical protein
MPDGSSHSGVGVAPAFVAADAKATWREIGSWRLAFRAGLKLIGGQNSNAFFTKGGENDKAFTTVVSCDDLWNGFHLWKHRSCIRPGR